MASFLSGSGKQENLAIRIEYYRQMDIRPLLPGESAIALWKRMKESCEVSDVLVLNQNGEIHCYYVNEDYPQLFIRVHPIKPIRYIGHAGYGKLPH